MSVFFGAPSIQGYEYRGELGRGGMGLVIHAFDTRLNRDVAIKLVCHAEGREMVRARFQREAKTLARLEDVNIARVFDYGEESGMPYLVMEYVPGKTLREVVLESLRLHGRVPDFGWTLRIFEKLASALRYCHKEGVLHRDIKPENIMIDQARERPVLIDFGLIGKAPGEDALPGFSQSLSRSGAICGTWQYMSPEQMSGKDKEQPLTEATDIWSFGSSLYFCLTGKEPYEAANDVEFFTARGDGPPIPVRKRNPDIPRWIAKLCDSCLKMDPEKRPDFYDWLEAAAKEGVINLPPLVLIVFFIATSLLVGFGVNALKGPKEAVKVEDKEVSQTPPPTKDKDKSKEDGSRIKEAELKARQLKKGLTALNDRLNWNVLEEATQDLVIKEIGQRLGPNYEHFETRLFQLNLDTGVTLGHRLGCFRHKATGIIFHLLPGGRYSMGGLQSESKPIHEVTIRPFLMGRTEVTWTQLSVSKLFKMRSDFPAYRLDPDRVIEWLTEEGQGFRLPSESEWEYACRAGSKTRFFWGESFNDRYCWGSSNAQRRGHLASEHKDAYNAFGLIDMAGNYFEPCADAWNRGYRDGPYNEKPRFLGDRTKMLVRGGCYFNPQRQMRSGFRYGMERKAQAVVGLRVAKSLP